MKKLLLFIIFSVVAFELKAQQSTLKTLELNKNSLFDSIPKLSFKQQNDVKALFLPKLKPNQKSYLIAELDHMPIAKPLGNFNMPIIQPDGTVIYTMPKMHLPPIFKPEK